MCEKQASGQNQDRQSCVLGLKTLSEAPWSPGPRVCSKAHQGQPGPIKEATVSECLLCARACATAGAGWVGARAAPRGRAWATHIPPRVFALRGPLSRPLADCPLRALAHLTLPAASAGSRCLQEQRLCPPLPQQVRKYISDTYLVLEIVPTLGSQPATQTVPQAEPTHPGSVFSLPEPQFPHLQHKDKTLLPWDGCWEGNMP